MYHLVNRHKKKNESPTGLSFLLFVAEREGFEPSVRIHVHMISNHAPSAARTPLHKLLYNSIT